MFRILIVDDDEYLLASLQNLLTFKKYSVDLASNPIDAKELFHEHDYDIVLLDVKMPGISGMELLNEFLSDKPSVSIIMISGESTISIAVDALKRGAFDFVEKPIDPKRLLNSIRNALDRQKLFSEKNRLISALKERYKMVGQSPAMQTIFETIEQVADLPAKVLITGESGTGKELVARALHFSSKRSSGPFVKINCAAIPKDLMENELFGHKKGAYTGAMSEQPGKIQAADGGTLFLDEIGDMDLMLQAKLLHVIQDKEFIMLGASNSVKVDVRIIAATNQNLEQRIKEGRFRRDLFHRLNVVQIHIPPLRKRKEDIEPMANRFLHEFAEMYNKRVLEFTPAAIQVLMDYHWPGNVRELKNAVEKMVIFSKSERIGEIEARKMLRSGQQNFQTTQGLNSLKEQMAAMEREFILQAIAEANGNLTKAAEALGITRSALFKKKRKLGIE